MLKAENLDFANANTGCDHAVLKGGCDHVALESDARDWRAAGQGELRWNLHTVWRFVEREDLHLAIQTSGCDGVVLQCDSQFH